jgi:hypothetical protein
MSERHSSTCMQSVPGRGRTLVARMS